MITRLSLLVLLSFTLIVPARAQVSLASLADEANAGWMFGSWKTTTDNGDALQLNIAWDLDKHVVVLTVKTGDVEAKGYTVLEPGAEFPTYFGADNRGTVSKGNWNFEDGELILRLESSRPYESPRKWASVFGGSASSGLEIRLHDVESWGGLSYPAMTTMKFKKQ
jgi:hypothetical protein